jgi:hypothetical protein
MQTRTYTKTKARIPPNPNTYTHVHTHTSGVHHQVHLVLSFLSVLCVAPEMLLIDIEHGHTFQ